VTIFDEEVPLATILDEDVPLANVPKTGDMSQAWYAAIISAVFGLLGLTALEKRKRR
jgi:LPXTG-motif cell wall-anchored protein